MTTTNVTSSGRSQVGQVLILLSYVFLLASARPTPAGDGDIEAVSFPSHPASVEELRRMEARVVKLIREKLTPATVGVQGSSGVIVSRDGVVACAAHTIASSGLGINGEATVTLPDGVKLSAKVLAIFKEMDTAILKITDGGPFVYAEPLKDDSDVTPETWVIQAGYPRTYSGGRPAYVRLGRVVERQKQGETGTVFLNDVGVAGGNSGGPVFDLQGRMIGVTNSGGRGRRGGSHFTAIAPIAAAAVWEKVLSGKAENIQPSGPVPRQRQLRPIVADPSIPDRCLEVLKAVAARPARSVASIIGPGDVRRLGTVCSADGSIVTKGGDWPAGTKVSCALHDGRELTGAVVATDRRYDLALVVVRATDLVPVEWGKAEPASVGRWVVASGQHGTAIAAGTIGAVGVAAPAIQAARIAGGGGIVRSSAVTQGTGYRSYPELVWHTAWLEAAELGGPLVDLDGKALGIAIERPSELAGYMVPGAVIQEFLATQAPSAVPPGQRSPVGDAATEGQP